MNLRDKFLSLDDRPVKQIDVPEWGAVHIRTLTAADQERIRHYQHKDQDAKLTAFVTVLAVCDEEGNRVFTLDDLDALCEKSAKATWAIFTASIEQNRIDEKKVDDAEGKSATTTS